MKIQKKKKKTLVIMKGDRLIMRLGKGGEIRRKSAKLD